MNELLERLQTTAVAVWVQESIYGYPALLVLHAVGLALLVGVLGVINLQLLGVGRPLSSAVLRKLMPLVWTGFYMNALSGVLMFIADAVKFYDSTVFRIKVLCIALAVALAYVIGASALVGSSDPRASARVRMMAAGGLFCWLTAIVSGRLMAYME